MKVKVKSMDMVFSDNLKKFRQQKNLTQEQAAEILNVSVHTVSRWECNTTSPDIAILPQIAKLYCVTIDDLFRKTAVVYENYAQRLAVVYEATHKPEDFISAELEVVPAGKAREAGFDRSMILSYGQDDRVCAFSSLKAMLEIEDVERTACCILVDKEEIGSVGATGMQSRFFENMVAEVMELAGEYSELNVRRCLASSCMLSSDVSSAFDPSFASSFDKKNVAYLGNGMVFNKFTGARGKSGSNDANAEYLGHIRMIFEKEQVHFQTAELGRVDLGGGGTIAYILALYGMNVIDSGVAVLNMHAPWEATSKADVYEAKRGYVAFCATRKCRCDSSRLGKVLTK